MEDHVVVPPYWRFGAAPLDAKPAGHAEMHDESFAGGERDQEVLGSALHGQYRPIGQTRTEFVWKRRAEIRPANEDALESAARHRRVESSAYRFDFRKFGHVLEL